MFVTHKMEHPMDEQLFKLLTGSMPQFLALTDSAFKGNDHIPEEVRIRNPSFTLSLGKGQDIGGLVQPPEPVIQGTDFLIVSDDDTQFGIRVPQVP